MGAFDDAPEVQFETREAWRAWLEANHATATGVWLVTWRPRSGRGALDYEASVEEALCFGWVDSRGGKVDAERSKLYFAPRKARSGWARPNKERIERLTASGRMTPAGMAVVERARADGSWTVLDSVERGDVPDDLAAAFDDRPPAGRNWEAFPKSVRRSTLEWIALARRPETRARRIEEAATLVQRNERPNERRPRT